MSNITRTTQTEIAELFSIGQFDKTYDQIADNAEWIVVSENHFKGKEAIIKNCKEVDKYFKSVRTEFKTLHIISENNKVVITGTAEFSRDGIRLSFVEACDFYEFNENNKIVKITSYCIQS